MLELVLARRRAHDASIWQMPPYGCHRSRRGLSLHGLQADIGTQNPTTGGWFGVRMTGIGGSRKLPALLVVDAQGWRQWKWHAYQGLS